jgi:hypothetical protein
MATLNPALAKALENTPERFRWYDNSESRDLHAKATRAILAYTDAYGEPPEFIWVHPRNRIDYLENTILGVNIFETTGVMFNNFVLGVDRQSDQIAGLSA